MSLEEKFAIDIRDHSINKSAKYLDKMWFFEEHSGCGLVIHVVSKKNTHVFQS